MHGKPEERVWCAPFQRDRRELLPLLKLADDSEEQVRSYLYLGEVIVAAEFGRVLGHALVVRTDASGVFELRSIAVLESRQRQGIGGMLVRAVRRYCFEQGASQLMVSTSIADANAIRFYLRHGFRPSSIVRDAFTEKRGYPKAIAESGLPLNDTIEFELHLDSTAQRT